MPYINVNDVYIMDNTGKQVDDAVDYALANSNRNLLDNPWLTIRQRGDGPFTGAVYTVDRWRGYGGTTVTPTSNGVTLTQASGSHINFFQYFTDEFLNSILGKTVTVSMMDANGTVYSATKTLPATIASGVNVSIGRLSDVIIAYLGNRPAGRTNAPSLCFYGSPTTVQTVDIRAVKLELGSYSTLANDVPPDYESEKRKCMAYFQRIRINTNYNSAIGFGFIVNNMRVFIPLAVPLRGDTFSVSATNTGGMSLIGNGTNAVVTAVSPLAIANHGGVVMDVATSTTLTGNQIYLFRFINNTAYLDISADL